MANYRKDTLLNYIVSQSEKDLVLSFENKPIIAEYDAKDCISKLIDILARWRWMSGINSYNQDEDEVAKELYLIAQFVSKNYPKITIEEIQLAIDLSLTDKLDTDVRTFNTFSPMYVSRILNAYLEYKLEIGREIIQRKIKEDEKKESEVVASPQQKMDTTIDFIRYLYDKYKNEGIVEDYFSSMYLYLRRTNKFSPTKEMVNEALQYAKQKVVDYNNKHFADVLFRKEKQNNEDVEKRFARDYCVMRFFDTLDIDDFISKIQISEFV